MKKSIIAIASLGLVGAGLFSARIVSADTEPSQSSSSKTNYTKDYWHPGVPKVFRSSGQVWISNYQKTSSAKDVGAVYERDVTKLSKNHGFNITPVYFDKDKHYKTTGADTNAYAWKNPHYNVINKNTYQIISGAMGKDSFFNEVTNTSKMFGTTNLVKVINNNKIVQWTYQSATKHSNAKLIDKTVMYRYSKLPKNIKIAEFN